MRAGIPRRSSSRIRHRRCSACNCHVARPRPRATGARRADFLGTGLSRRSGILRGHRRVQAAASVSECFATGLGEIARRRIALALGDGITPRVSRLKAWIRPMPGRRREHHLVRLAGRALGAAQQRRHSFSASAEVQNGAVSACWCDASIPARPAEGVARECFRRPRGR